MNKKELMQKRKEVLDFILSVEKEFDIYIEKISFDLGIVHIDSDILHIGALDKVVNYGFCMNRGRLTYQIK